MVADRRAASPRGSSRSRGTARAPAPSRRWSRRRRRQDRGQRAVDRLALVRVVRDAHQHQQRAEVRVAEPQRAELVRPPGDLAAGELRHQDGDLERDRPQPRRVAVALDVEAAGLGVVERHQVEAREVARRVVEEHVLGARIAGVDAPVGRAGVPLVDRRVVLDARVGAGPRGVRDLVPERARRDGPVDATCRCGGSASTRAPPRPRGGSRSRRAPSCSSSGPRP